jgi:5-methylcytosine-specific restriction enzyme A
MPIRMCIEAGCPNVVKTGRCPEHRKQRDRERRLPGERTAYAIQTYHAKKWITTREKVLNRDPICRVCDNALSEQVDHIKPLSQGGARFELVNLQGICVRCHAIKSAGEST